MSNGIIPKGTISNDVIRDMCLVGCSMREIAALFGIHEDTLSKDPYYRKMMDMYNAELAFKIRTAQIDVAIETKDVKMLIWLGKAHCGQRESPKELIITTNQLNDKDLESEIKKLLPYGTENEVIDAVVVEVIDVTEIQDTDQ